MMKTWTLALLLLANFFSAVSGAEESIENSASSAESRRKSSELRFQVFLPPVLEKEKNVWGSIYDQFGNIAPQQKIVVNDIEVESDDYGSFHFLAPVADKVDVHIAGIAGSDLSYWSTASGLLVSDQSAVDLVDRLDSMPVFSGKEPVIALAPSVVETQQTIVVLGKNFSGKQGDDDLEVADRNADILAASPRSLVAVTSKFMKMGPMKEMRVSSHEQTSLPVELDVCKVSVKNNSQPNGKAAVRIDVLGTTLPAVIALTNNSRSDLRFGGWKLGSQNLFLSQGGVQNAFMVEPSVALSSNEFAAHLVSNGLFDAYSMKTNRNLLSKSVYDTEEQAEIIRLKKRVIGLESQLNSLNTQRAEESKSAKLDLNEESDLELKSKALSSRIFRINRMLQARRTVLESCGYSDYDKLMDLATSGGASSLDALASDKALGFTESRLLRIVAKRAAEEKKQSEMEANAAWTYKYNSPDKTMLNSYRKKYGKRGYVPPPPNMATLIPPPAPFKPDLKDMGPFLMDLNVAPPAPLSSKAKSSKGKPATSASETRVNSKQSKKKARR